MSGLPTEWLAAAAAAALLLLLGLRLRGPRAGADLLGPPKGKKKRLSRGEARKLRALVARGRSDEALRLIREAGYDDPNARKLVRFIETLEAAIGERKAKGTGAAEGWTETLRSGDGLPYGRASDFNEALHEQDLRGRRGELDPP